MNLSPEMQTAYKEINGMASKLALSVALLIQKSGLKAEGAIAVSSYEFNRRLEEAMFRVSDIMVNIAQQDPAAVSAMVDEKLATGDVQTGGPIDITGGKVN